MKRSILFVEQQAWRAGAQRVLGDVLRCVDGDYTPIVVFPEDGPFARELSVRGIETIVVSLGHYRAGVKSLADMAAFLPRSVYGALELAKIIRKRQVTLVYINGPRCVVAGVLAARITLRPSLFHLHMSMTRTTDLWITRWAARHATKTIACSQTSAACLCGRDQRLLNRVQVIYNAVRPPPAARQKPDSPRGLAQTLAQSDDAVAGLVGRVTPGKGHHVLLEATALLRRAGWRIQIVFVGAPGANDPADASYVRHLESLARDLRIGGQVHWAGFQDDPNPFYSAMDVLVIPSTVSEGLPLVALEALQAGVPVIGSNSGGIPEIVHDGLNGLLVPPGDAAALAGSLDRLLSRPELRAKLQADARASVDGQFSYECFRIQMHRVFAGIFATFACPGSREDKGVDGISPGGGKRSSSGIRGNECLRRAEEIRRTDYDDPPALLATTSALDAENSEGRMTSVDRPDQAKRKRPEQPRIS